MTASDAWAALLAAACNAWRRYATLQREGGADGRGGRTEVASIPELRVAERAAQDMAQMIWDVWDGAGRPAALTGHGDVPRGWMAVRGALAGIRHALDDACWRQRVASERWRHVDHVVVWGPAWWSLQQRAMALWWASGARTGARTGFGTSQELVPVRQGGHSSRFDRERFGRGCALRVFDPLTGWPLTVCPEHGWAVDEIVWEPLVSGLPDTWREITYMCGCVRLSDTEPAPMETEAERRLAVVAGPARLWATGSELHSGQNRVRRELARRWPEMVEALRGAVDALPPICWRCGEDIDPALTANYPPDGWPSHGTCPRDLP